MDGYSGPTIRRYPKILPTVRRVMPLSGNTWSRTRYLWIVLAVFPLWGLELPRCPRGPVDPCCSTLAPAAGSCLRGRWCRYSSCCRAPASSSVWSDARVGRTSRLAVVSAHVARNFPYPTRQFPAFVWLAGSVNLDRRWRARRVDRQKGSMVRHSALCGPQQDAASDEDVRRLETLRGELHVSHRAIVTAVAVGPEIHADLARAQAARLDFSDLPHLEEAVSLSTSPNRHRSTRRSGVQRQRRPPPSHPRERHRVTNWREYDEALRQRGSLTV